MAVFSMTCPHCNRQNMTFTVATGIGHPQQPDSNRQTLEVFACCNGCGRGVLTTASVQKGTHNTLTNPGDLMKMHGVLVGSWLPTAKVADIPDFLPEPVAAAFREAEELRLAGFRGPSGNAYRRALEAALKVVDETLKGSLYSRIESLANNGRLTTNMKEFAHRIRSLGNEASHETPLTPNEDIDNMAIFTRLFLMYEFTLPGMLPKPDNASQQPS